MKDFQVGGPITGVEADAQEEAELQQPPEGEDNIARWRRVARLAVLKSAEHRWGQVSRGIQQLTPVVFKGPPCFFSSFIIRCPRSST